jgi:hypothetical protein
MYHKGLRQTVAVDPENFFKIKNKTESIIFIRTISSFKNEKI